MPERRSREEPPHDILAAEAFAVPAPDPRLRPRHDLRLPGDPAGIAEPHDILAAEEFAMPAPEPRSGGDGGGRAGTPGRAGWASLVGAAAGLLLWRRRRRRR